MSVRIDGFHFRFSAQKQSFKDVSRNVGDALTLAGLHFKMFI